LPDRPRIRVASNEYTCLRCGETVTPALYGLDEGKADRVYCPFCEEDAPPMLVPTASYLRPDEIETA
jgi:DNA-directed RNA polymerase subunit RPC12/RpoP